MRRLIVLAATALVALLAWTGVIVAGELEGWWRRPLAARGDPAAFAAAAVETAHAARPGNFALVLIEDGQPAAEHFASIGRPVDRDTLFQVASVSKWLTAIGVMSLVDAGRVELDAPVDSYLRRWKLPPSEHDNRQVTVRRVLSHTAGLTDGLGYQGFEPGRPSQSLVDSLTQASDAAPGADGRVRVGLPPGEKWAYSGGGYTLLQLLIEDVTGEPFAAYMRRAVLVPLGMSRSTFALPQEGADNLAEFYDVGGEYATHYRFTATGAAALYTSAADLTHLIQAHLPGPHGEPPGRGVLRPQTLEAMRRPHASQLGADIWGLGLILYAPNGAGGYILGHDGSNYPAINTTARFDPATGDGFVLLVTGHPSLATRLAGEWVFWKTGEVDKLTLMMDLRRTFILLAAGWAAIAVIALAVGWRVLRRSRTRPENARYQPPARRRRAQIAGRDVARPSSR